MLDIGSLLCIVGSARRFIYPRVQAKCLILNSNIEYVLRFCLMKNKVKQNNKNGSDGKLGQPFYLLYSSLAIYLEFPPSPMWPFATDIQKYIYIYTYVRTYGWMFMYPFASFLDGLISIRVFAFIPMYT